MAKRWTNEQLENLDRRTLQELAKENGVKANIKARDMFSNR